MAGRPGASSKDLFGKNKNYLIQRNSKIFHHK
jgi:hypothetical protein